MPRISGLADICERPHMSTEQRKAAKAAAAGRGANVWSIAGAPKRGAMRSLIIHVCGHLPMATSMVESEQIQFNYVCERKRRELFE